MADRKKPFKYSTTFYRKKEKMLKMINPISLQERSSSSSSESHAILSELHLTPEPTSPDLCPDESVSLCPASDAAQNMDLDMDASESVEDIYFSEMLNEFDDYKELELEREDPLKCLIRNWAINFNITHKALSSLLNILISNGHTELPKDSRTLLSTPKEVDIEKMGEGKFWYHGVENILVKKFPNIDKSMEFKLNFHIDGLPINSSSKNQFWPILMNVVEIKMHPEVVAIYCGDSKPPSASMYLSQFINELRTLLGSGIEINGYFIKLKLNSFICDTPARCFIKCVVPYNAYHGCMKCVVVGEYYRQGHHMSYPQTDCRRRTNQEFHNKGDPGHHQKISINDDEVILNSPLEELPIDMIRDIPIADSLHLLDLGIMKRCLKGWVKGDFNFRTKFFANQVDTMSAWLKKVNVPNEIHRGVRGFDCLGFWKGTEYRTFLMYLGPVILKDNLDTASYKHFLLLFCAVTILSTKHYLSQHNFINIAEKLLLDYVETFINIYGIDSISSNVHNLIHVTEDVRQFGPLPVISSYPFENALGTLKKLLRSGNEPLAQVAKRLLEKFGVDEGCEVHLEHPEPCLKSELSNLPSKPPNCRTLFKSLKFADLEFIGGDSKNQWILMKNNVIVKMIGAYGFENKIFVYGCSIKHISNFFNNPFESSRLNIYISSSTLNTPCSFEVDHIKCKLVCLEYNEEYVFLPLLHSLDIFN